MFQKGHLLVAQIDQWILNKYNIYHMSNIIYGVVIDTTHNSIDIQLSHPYESSINEIQPRSAGGVKLNMILKNINPWKLDKTYVINVQPHNVIKHYFFENPIHMVTIKEFLQKSFEQYVPRYISHVRYDDRNVISRFKAAHRVIDDKYELLTIDDPTGNFVRVTQFDAYSTKIVRMFNDPFIGQNQVNPNILISSNRYKCLDFLNECDGLPTTKTFNCVPNQTTLVFGIPECNDKNNYYFKEWFIGNEQFLLFWTLLYYPTHKTIKDNDIDIMRDLSMPKVTDIIDNMTDTVLDTWYNKHYSFYTFMPFDLLNYLFMFMRQDKPNDIYTTIYPTLPNDKKKLFDRFFQVLMGK